MTDLFRAYFDARKHKRNTFSQLNFELDFEKNLVELYHEIIENRYEIGRSMCFISNGKVKREVFAANFRDRVVHHLIYNYISPMFERSFIEDCYSCRVGYGTRKGIERLEHHMRSCTDNYRKPAYILKLDIQGYFMSINRSILYEKVEKGMIKYAGRKNKDGIAYCDTFNMDRALSLIEKIIFNDPITNCFIRGGKKDWEDIPLSKSLFHSAYCCGLPIGNLTSQLFSNIYLNDFDHYVKKDLGVKHYGRYVDDFFIIHPDKQILLYCMARIKIYLKQSLGLVLHPKKIYLQEVRKGVVFLGAVEKPYRKYITRNARHNIFETFGRISKYLSGVNRPLTKEEFCQIQSVVNSYFGYLSHYKTFHLKQKLIRHCLYH
ncbi:MAG: RNA-directed DNA polymerase [Bacteroidales bacterium]|nr:RNA-directed DNA polymerase [Bacteroidales bacterium]